MLFAWPTLLNIHAKQKKGICFFIFNSKVASYFDWYAWEQWGGTETFLSGFPLNCQRGFRVPPRPLTVGSSPEFSCLLSAQLELNPWLNSLWWENGICSSFIVASLPASARRPLFPSSSGEVGSLSIHPSIPCSPHQVLGRRPQLSSSIFSLQVGSCSTRAGPQNPGKAGWQQWWGRGWRGRLDPGRIG